MATSTKKKSRFRFTSYYKPFGHIWIRRPYRTSPNIDKRLTKKGWAALTTPDVVEIAFEQVFKAPMAVLLAPPRPRFGWKWPMYHPLLGYLIYCQRRYAGQEFKKIQQRYRVLRITAQKKMSYAAKRIEVSKRKMFSPEYREKILQVKAICRMNADATIPRTARKIIDKPAERKKVVKRIQGRNSKARRTKNHEAYVAKRGQAAVDRKAYIAEQKAKRQAWKAEVKAMQARLKEQEDAEESE